MRVSLRCPAPPADIADMNSHTNSQNGFTLIELLVVIVIIGILSGLSMQTYNEYKARAAYSVADRTLRDARTALEAALAEPDKVYDPVSYEQRAQGPLMDAAAKELLSAVRLPKNTKLEVYREPTCIDASCIKESFEARHCQALQYVAWTRFGDGVEVLQQNVSGAGCQ